MNIIEKAKYRINLSNNDDDVNVVIIRGTAIKGMKETGYEVSFVVSKDKDIEVLIEGNRVKIEFEMLTNRIKFPASH